MNIWTITTALAVALLIAVLYLDSIHHNKMIAKAANADQDARSWKMKYEEAKMELRILTQKDAKDVAHAVLIRDEQIDRLNSSMKDLKEQHAREMAIREQTVFRLEKMLHESWETSDGGKKK